MPFDSTSSTNTMIIEAPKDKVWWYFSTTSGWNGYLSDIATSSHSRDEILIGDTVTLIIGELTYKAHCIKRRDLQYIGFEDRYQAIFPNGSTWDYQLRTSFSLSSYQNDMTKVTVHVTGYTEDEMLQWVKECGEMGWRQSLFNLKCILELGLDLRNAIFNYPRLGVLNYTATEEQLQLANPQKTDSFQGNLLKSVYPGGPAALAGLQAGDIVTHIASVPVPTYYDFVRALSQFYGRNSTVDVCYVRDGRSYTEKIVLTYDDQFTGMIDPEKKSLDEVKNERQKGLPNTK